MAFTKTILLPQQSYTAQERARAASTYGHWQQLDPRCTKGSLEVLRLRNDGPLLRWDGEGADSGRYLEISFNRKPSGKLRLMAAAGNMAKNADMPLLIARAIKDVLDSGAPAVYYYATAADQQGAPEWYGVLTAIVANLELLGPFKVAETNNKFEHKWEVTPA